MSVIREQEELKEKLEVEDSEEVTGWEEDTLPFTHLTTIAGVDISFDKTDPNHACAMLAVLSYPQLKVLQKSISISFTMKHPREGLSIRDTTSTFCID